MADTIVTTHGSMLLLQAMVFLQPRVRFRIRLSLRKNAKILAGYSTVSSSNAERNSENLRGQCYQVGARALALTFGNTKRTTMISTIQTTALKHLAPYRDKITVCHNFTSDCARTVTVWTLFTLMLDTIERVWQWPKLRCGGISAGHDYVTQDDGPTQSGQDWTVNYDGTRGETRAVVKGAVDA